MGFQGDLDSFGLAAIFQTLTANKQSGTLHVFDETTDRYLEFSQGSIRSVSTGERQQVSLGEILVARAVITHDQLATALTRQAESKELLGNVLVEMGVCTHDEIQRALRFQMEEEIYDLFTWHGAKFEFDETQRFTAVISRDQRVSEVEVNVSGIVIEAMRRIDEWERIARLIPSSNFIPMIPPERQDEALLLTLSPEDQRIVSFMDGINSIDAITKQSCLGRYTVTQFIARMIQEENAREATLEEMRQSAEKLVLQGALQQAVLLQKRIVELDPDDLTDREQLANSFVALGQDREAAVQYNRIAEDLCGQEQFDEAADAVDRAAKLMPDELPIIRRQAEINLLAEREHEAAVTWGRVIRMIEEQGKKSAALEAVDQALVDLPTEESLLRTKARLLLETGNSRDSIDVYELLAEMYLDRGDRQSALGAYRSVIHIDSNRGDIRERMRELQISDRERERGRRALIVGTLIAFVVAGVGGYWFSYEYGVGQKKAKAIAEANKLIEEAESDTVSESDALELRKQALQILSDAGKPFALMGFSESKRATLEDAQRIRIKNFEAQVADMIARENAIIEDWLRLRDHDSREAEAARMAFDELAAKTPPTENVRKAKALLQAHQAERKRIQDEIRSIVKMVGDTDRDPDNRFLAYQRAKKDYPHLLAERAPDGLLGLTLPARVSVVSQTDAILPATVRIGNTAWPKQAPTTVEIPIDRDVPVVIVRKGFGDAEGVTPLIRGPNPSTTYRVVLKRALLWKTAIRGAAEAAPSSSPDGQTVYVGTSAGNVFALNSDTGKRLWPQGNRSKLPTGAIFNLPLTVTSDVLLAVGQNGVLVSLDKTTGTPIWPRSGERGMLDGVSCAGYSVTRLQSGGGEYQPGRVDILLANRGRPPIYAINGASGEVLWPTGEGKINRLSDKIGASASAPFHLPERKQILLIDQKARLHIILEDGTYVSMFKLFDGRIEGTPVITRPDPEGPVLILAAEMSIGLHCFELAVHPALKLSPRWLCKEFSDQSLKVPLFVDGEHVYVGLDSERVLRLPLKNGTFSSAWDFRGLPGPVAGSMTRSGDRLLVPCSSGSGSLAAIRIGEKGLEEMIWHYRPDRGARGVSGVTLVEHDGQRRIVFGAGEMLFCLEDEEPSE